MLVVRERQAECYATIATVAFLKSMSTDRIILLPPKAKFYHTFHQHAIEEMRPLVDKGIVEQVWGNNLTYH